jgi:hypothetical protein
MYRSSKKRVASDISDAIILFIELANEIHYVAAVPRSLL